MLVVSDARYLSDLIQRMTYCPAYLDAKELVDLRKLFDEGVHKSDVLVVLATEGVFTRPWWCAVAACTACGPSLGCDARATLHERAPADVVAAFWRCGRRHSSRSPSCSSQ